VTVHDCRNPPLLSELAGDALAAIFPVF
jgi:hypothetical protein